MLGETTTTTLRVPADQLAAIRSEMGDDLAFIHACQDGLFGPRVAELATDEVAAFGCSDAAPFADDDVVAAAIVNAVADSEPEEGAGYEHACALLAEAADVLNGFNFPLSHLRSDLERRDEELRPGREFGWVLLGLTEGW